MKLPKTKVEYITIKIDKKVHIELDLALAQIRSATGHKIKISEFVGQSIREKIGKSKIL